MSKNINPGFNRRAVLRTQMTAFIKEAEATPLLTKAEERELSRRIMEHNDPEAREKLIKANLRLVIFFAHKYRGRGVDEEDLISAGRIGLVRAAQDFDHTIGTFSNYASRRILKAIKSCIFNESRVVRLPSHIHELGIKIRMQKRAYLKKSKKEIPAEQLAAALKVKPERIEKCDNALNMSSQSLDTVPKASQNDDIPALQVFPRLVTRVRGAEFIGRLSDSISMLPDERDQQILRLRFGVGSSVRPMMLREVAEQLGGISHERVRQLEEKALLELREFWVGKACLDEFVPEIK